MFATKARAALTSKGNVSASIRQQRIPKRKLTANIFRLLPGWANRSQRDPKAEENGRIVQKLLDACEGTDRGLSTTKDQRLAIEGLVDSLVELNQGLVTTDETLSATWKLLWTTEKETQFIVKNANFFKTAAGDVYQVIDVEENSLQNVITFPPDGAFVVDSTIDVENDQRVNFKFRSATLKLPNRSINLPPFGSGWFESVYCDDKIRVARDIRGDTLIVARDGPPRSFF